MSEQPATSYEARDALIAAIAAQAAAAPNATRTKASPTRRPVAAKRKALAKAKRGKSRR